MHALRTLLAGLWLAPALQAAPPDLKALTVFPPRLSLTGSDAAAQLIVTGELTGGRLVDLTGDAAFTIENSQVARISASGRVVPLADGTTTIQVRAGNQVVTIPCDVRQTRDDLPINFANHVVPVFTKLGCNSGGCHGKQSGQNGFRLSLLGFEPELDFTSLVKESRGRRTFPAAPEQSLLLLKASGAIAHGGGKRMAADSDEYRIVRRWIAAGMPYGDAGDPTVTRISIVPDSRTLARQSRQQLVVLAEYSDGSTLDVTRRVQFDSNDLELATVDPTGLIRTLGLTGQATVMARYQGKVAVFRAIVPNESAGPVAFAESSIVDRHTKAQWQRLGLQPSEKCTDEQFLRRASLDITGTLPTADQVRKFVADADPAKRTKLVDSLLESPDYAAYFAGKWADVLRVKRRQDLNRAAGTFAFHAWIRESIAADKPLDQFVRELLTATGAETQNPPVVWYKELQTPEQFVDDVSQVFLGQRVACAQCHHHPYERWSQDDFWSMAAFFGRVGRKPMPIPGAQNQQNRPPQLIFTRAGGTVTNKRSNRPAPIKPLDGEALAISADDDPREKLVDWMVDPKNPFFARAVANRYWAHFFGRGIVDPLDDMRVTNPPSNPALLDALAESFVTGKFSLKSLVRTICTSQTYQLSSQQNDSNRNDKQNYARFYPKRMSAEVLVDAVSHATGSPTTFANLPRDRHAPARAIELPDEAFPSYFLDVFGRPQRISACECERVSEANLAQALHLLNSDELQGKISRTEGRADTLAKDTRPVDEKLDDLFLAVLARKPTQAERDAAVAQIARHEKNPRLAYENILWALLNTKEFLFIQ